MAMRTILTSVLAAVIASPAIAFAGEETPRQSQETPDYYSGLEDLSLRRDIADLNHGYALSLDQKAPQTEADSPYASYQGGSSGGYVNFGSPATSTFLGSAVPEKEESLFDNVVFGVDWRPEIAEQNSILNRAGHNPDSPPVEHLGLRADVTALLRDEEGGEEGTSAWRISGMLGSTSLSLVPENNNDPDAVEGGKGLLWDVAIGWTSGGMSLNAGYQSGFGLDNNGEEDATGLSVLSLGADYAILPGLSVYGEFNVVDGPPDPLTDGYGAVVIVGTGVNF